MRRRSSNVLLVLSLAAGIVAAAVGAASSSEFVELLELIPDTPETRSEVYLNDYHAASLAIGLVPPLPYAGEATDYMLQLNRYGALRPGPYISGYVDWKPSIFNSLLYEAAGYDLRHVAASALAGGPPSLYGAVVLDDSVDANVVYHRVQVNENWPLPGETTYHGVSILSWGEDYMMDFRRISQPPVYDHLGRGARLGFMEQTLFYTVWTDGLLSMIDTARGTRPSLADVEALRLMAEGLQILGTFGAYMTEATDRQTLAALIAAARVAEGTIERLQSEVMLSPYCAFAVGIGRDESGPFMGLVLVHESESLAQENVDRIRQRFSQGTSSVSGSSWSDIFDPGQLEVSVDGRTLRARVPIDPPSVWLRWVHLGDPLLLHEGSGPCL